MSDIFREIDEELRRDNLRKLWSRYGRYIVALAVLVLVAAGGIMAWRDHQLSERRAQSMRYSSALSLVREGKDADAAKVFAVIAQESGGYAMLASFEEAELLAKSGDRKAAAAAYDRIAVTGGLDSVFGELAALLINHGNEPFFIETGMRIAQLLVLPVPRVRWVEVTELPFTKRGPSGFGHTGTK